MKAHTTQTPKGSREHHGRPPTHSATNTQVTVGMRLYATSRGVRKNGVVIQYKGRTKVSVRCEDGNVLTATVRPSGRIDYGRLHWAAVELE